MSKVKTRICGQVEGEIWKIAPRSPVVDETSPPAPPSEPPPELPAEPAPPLFLHPEWEIAHPPVAQLPGVAAQLIGERMRTMYGRLVKEPVPDTLLDLVRRLEDKERSE